jgi:hypothetical protein
MNPIIGGSAASPYNDIQIPVIMAAVYLITKGVAFGLWTLFFFAESFRLKVQAVRAALPGATIAKPRYADFLWRAFALLVSIGWLYSWTFLKIVSLCDHISMLLSNEDQWMSLVSQLSANTSVSIPFLNVTFPTLVGAAAITALQYVQDVFIMIRFVLLALLFCIGPIAWAFSISELGAGVLRGWFKNTWQVSFWLVIFSVIKAAVIPLAVNALSGDLASSTVVPIVYAVVILAAVFMIPTLTAAVFSEANLGAVASAAMSVATYSTVRAAAARGESAHSGIAGKDRIQSLAQAAEAFKGGAQGRGGAAKLWAGTAAVASGLAGNLVGGQNSGSAARTR